MTINFVLPWPPAKLSPNARLHFMALAREKKQYRRACWATALQQGAKRIEAERLSVHLTFVPPNRRARDEDNLVASMKSGLDGLSDAIGVDDSCWKLTHDVAHGEVGGMVRVRVEVAE